MRYQALTVSGEYGSGGGQIAAAVARYLGWRLVNKELIAEISRREQVSIKDAATMDEKIDPWIYRITRSVWGKGADGFSQITPVHLFDAEEAAFMSKVIIEEAYRGGNCVIVGRGSQCILQGKEDVFHVFVYARWRDRVRRIRKRVEPGTDVEELIRRKDSERTEYVKLHYRENRLDPYLYDLMVDSKNQFEKIPELIISTMKMVPAIMAAS